jgi:hypothetical protein
MMDLFDTKFNGQVDLDDPATYHGENFQINTKVHELRSWAWSEIGKSFVYMDYLETWEGHSWEPQRSRVVEFAKEFASEFHNRGQDTKENRLWWKKFVYKFLWEVENQC